MSAMLDLLNDEEVKAVVMVLAQLETSPDTRHFASLLGGLMLNVEGHTQKCIVMTPEQHDASLSAAKKLCERYVSQEEPEKDSHEKDD